MCVCVCVCVCLSMCMSEFLAPGFTSTSAEAKDYSATLGVMYGQHVESLSRCCIMDRVYLYKWVAIQIPHIVELAPIPFSSRKFLPNRNSKQCLFPLYELVAVRIKSHYPVVPVSYGSVVHRHGSLGSF